MALAGLAGCSASEPSVRLPEEGPACEALTPATASLRPLTRFEYDNTIEDLLGDESQPALGFPPENEVLGFRNNAEANLANPLLVESYLAAAEGIAARAVDRIDELAPCSDGEESECGRSFVREFGARAFRRPLSEEEALAFDTLFEGALPDGYTTAVELTLAALLSSPQFLYRVEGFRAPTPETGAVALGPYELATRLSYFLIASTPDAELLTAAAENRLQTDEEIEAQARRLLEAPRAREAVLAFHEQWLNLSRLEGVVRESADVTLVSSELVADWKESLRRFVDDVFWNEGTLSALFGSPKVYVNDRLAPLYGGSAAGTDFVAVESPGERAGLLTQPALMALLAHSDQTAPVLRGVFVRESILCLEVVPPPPGLNTIPPPVDPNATTRERFAQHTAEPECAGCHVLIDGVGFGFERYDQFGRYRSEENGLVVDESGEMLETGDGNLDGEFDGALALSARLSESPVVRDCVATNFYRYAMGRLEEPNDACSLEQVRQRFAKSGGDFRELLIGITLSDAFRYRPAIEEAP